MSQVNECVTVLLSSACFCCLQAVDKASEVKAQLDARGFVYTAESLSHLANLSAEYKHDLDEALNYKQQL